MNKKKTKVDCYLTTIGTSGVNAQAEGDLSVPDPELATGEQIIKEALEEEPDDVSP